MLKTIALIGLGAAIAFMPLPAMAETDQSASSSGRRRPAATAPDGVA